MLIQELNYLQERLTDTEAISKLKMLFARHGVSGCDNYHADLSELEKLGIVHLIFGLIPKRAITRTELDTPLKPLIEEHLKTINIQYDECLLNILKHIGDQLFDTKSKSYIKSNKFGIAKLKARHYDIYTKISNEQNQRCKICGIKFEDGVIETLDHILPYKLVGDIPTGENWQILCEDCNQAKGDYISVMQFEQFHNWIYSSTSLQNHIEEHDRTTKYIALAHHKKCSKCGKTPKESRLYVINNTKHGISIFDNITVVCENCK